MRFHEALMKLNVAGVQRDDGRRHLRARRHDEARDEEQRNSERAAAAATDDARCHRLGCFSLAVAHVAVAAASWQLVASLRRSAAAAVASAAARLLVGSTRFVVVIVAAAASARAYAALKAKILRHHDARAVAWWSALR